jgi:methionyl-tRNA synthetase
MTKPFYITTPIFYCNGSPHLGHAYTCVVADVLARFKLLDGYDVLFVTGTDEHGQKVEAAAKKLGISPQFLVDNISSDFQYQAAQLDISNDDFIRTTETRHHNAARALWIRAANAGFIYKGEYSGFYAKKDEAFYNEDELIKQEDGSFIAKDTGAPVEYISEPSYFFALSEFQDKILHVLENNSNLIQPESKRNEMLSYVRSGLQDISISRSTFTWGIPVPGDPSHVMYVWFDALANYLTAIGFPDAENINADSWPPDVQIVGKEIIKFHAVYWLGFLMAADLPLPKKIFSHGHLTIDGKKMSKSDGNAISVKDILSPFEAEVDGIEFYGIDALRYFLMREIPFGNDGNFSQTALLNRYESDLVNDLGNLAQRVLSFVYNKTDGVIIAPENFTLDDYDLVILVNNVIWKVRESINNLAFSEALVEIWKIVSFANSYFVRNAPWTLIKTDIPRAKDVLYMSMYALRAIAILAYPFMPYSMDMLLMQLGISSKDFVLADFYSHVVEVKNLPKPEPIFPRLVK